MSKFSQEDFWSDNPCGAEGDFDLVANQRYNMEPYLKSEFELIRKDYDKYLEIGCGQGIDAINICKKLSKNSTYIAIDFSKESIIKAKEHLNNKKLLDDFQVEANFKVGDAQSLEFNNEEFDFIYSIGVFHHTPDPQKCIDEIYRVLKNNGEALIFLYRKGSIKVEIAKLLRLVQKLLDKIFRKERCIYKILNRKKSTKFGTMFLECFGVPWFENYSELEINKMFQKFKKIEVTPYGYNFPKFNKKNLTGKNKFGYFHKIHVIK